MNEISPPGGKFARGDRMPDRFTLVIVDVFSYGHWISFLKCLVGTTFLIEC